MMTTLWIDKTFGFWITWLHEEAIVSVTHSRRDLETALRVPHAPPYHNQHVPEGEPQHRAFLPRLLSCDWF